MVTAILLRQLKYFGVDVRVYTATLRSSNFLTVILMAKRTIPGFGELETAIMEAVWAKHPISVRDVLCVLDRGSAYTTVMTVMQRLHGKGMLKRQLVDNAYQYEPAVPKEQFVQQTVRKTVDDLVHGFGNVALAHFVGALDDIDPKRFDQLKRKLNHHA